MPATEQLLYGTSHFRVLIGKREFGFAEIGPLSSGTDLASPPAEREHRFETIVLRRALSQADIARLVAADLDIALELVHCGNGRTALVALALAAEAGALPRVILGNDAPSGTGVVALGILRLIAHLASLGGVAAESVICLATGNTARVHGLDTGVIAAGRSADLCIVDTPTGSVATTALEALTNGDLFGISMILIDGVPVIGRSRNTAPAARAAEVIKGPLMAGGGH